MHRLPVVLRDHAGEAVLEGEPRELARARDAQLAHDAAAVGLRRRVRDAQPLRDLLVGQRRADQRQHRALALREQAAEVVREKNL